MPITRDVRSATISTAASGDTTIVAASGAASFRVLAFQVVNDVATAQTVTFKSGAATIYPATSLPSAIGGVLQFGGPDNDTELFATAPGAALVLNLSAATAVSGLVVYRFARP
jgi:hypothetical protein